jgi:AcrR family transcriptional regulator
MPGFERKALDRASVLTVVSGTDMSVSANRTRAPERARALTRARLRASGQRLFAERGLHAVTSHDIADAAGVAAGTFYLHFPDKHALFRELVFEAIEELQRRLEREVLPRLGQREAAARARAEVLLAFAEEQGELVRLAFGRGCEAASVGADALDALAARLEEDHPAVEAQAIVGMWARVVSWWAERPGRAPRDEVLRTMIDLQLSGIAVRRSTP